MAHRKRFARLTARASVGGVLEAAPELMAGRA
jgi:hypothetical protein